MNQFLIGFRDELVKIGAFGQQTTPAGGMGQSSVANVMKNSYGAGAKSGLKGPQVATPTASRGVVAPSPLTTPSNMLDVASKSDGV